MYYIGIDLGTSAVKLLLMQGASRTPLTGGTLSVQAFRSC